MLGSKFAILSITAVSALAITDPGSRTDLWEISQGSVVTSHTGVWSPQVAITDMFGTTDSFLQELGQVVFADGQPEGSVHAVEWHTPTPVRVGSFALHASGDPDYANQRELASFTLRAKSPGSPIFDLTLYTYTATHPYQFENASDYLLLSDTISPVVAQDFRAEFVQWNAGRGFEGPRVIELDGFSPVPDSGTTAALLGIGLAGVTFIRRPFSGQREWS
jgi:hypothetical protein